MNQYSDFGSTGFELSDPSFGCGSVGGLIIRGSARGRMEAVSRALDAGINYFDTAAAYGDGQSAWHVLTKYHCKTASQTDYCDYHRFIDYSKEGKINSISTA